MDRKKQKYPRFAVNKGEGIFFKIFETAAFDVKMTDAVRM